MNLDPSTIDHFLIYLGIYRLGIIAAGVVCMWLGYRLFRKGLAPGGGPGDGETDLEASVGGNTLSLKGAAPGTLFALFGAALVVAMVVTGAPSVTLSNLEQAAGPGAGADSTLAGADAEPGGMTLVLRSQETQSIQRIERDFKNRAITAEEAYRDLSKIVQRTRRVR